jgi:DNA-binding MarR family transcriptional regulator
MGGIKMRDNQSGSFNRTAHALQQAAAFFSSIAKETRFLDSNEESTILKDKLASTIKIKRHLRERRSREVFFPQGLFAEPAWDILLDLYLTRYSGQKISVTSACLAAGVPSTTALRCLTTLESLDLVSRVADDKDDRRSFVSLTEKGVNAIENWASQV